jgi:tetratricopeptide (TPR) repeat protein
MRPVSSADPAATSAAPAARDAGAPLAAGRKRPPRRPLALALLALVALAVLAGLLAARQVRQRRAALRVLPAIDVSKLEPAMAEILTEARSAVLADPTSGAAWGKYGSVLLAQDFVAEAVVCYERAEQLDPREVRWPHLRGRSLERNLPDVALECFRRAAQISDAELVPKVHLAELLLSRGELEEAAVNLRRASELAPRDPRVLVALGRLALQQDRLGDALHWATLAAQARPPVQKAHLLLSQIYQRRGDQTAVAERLAILETLEDTDWADPLLDETSQYKRSTTWTVQAAQRLIVGRRVADAIRLLDPLGGENSQDARVITTLGKAYLHLGDLAQAEALLKRAIQMDPGQAGAHFELGNLAMRRDRIGEAAEHYDRTVRLDSSLAAAHYNLGICRRELGDHVAAIAALRDACHNQPLNFPAHRDLGALLLEAGRRDEALVHLRKAVKLAPHDPQTELLLQQAQADQPAR